MHGRLPFFVPLFLQVRTLRESAREFSRDVVSASLSPVFWDWCKCWTLSTEKCILTESCFFLEGLLCTASLTSLEEE